MKTSDILEDWFLDKFEVESIKDCKKTILMLPENYSIKFNNILHVSGLALKVVDRFQMSLHEFVRTRSKYDKYGVNDYTIPASCDHPDLVCYAYCSYHKHKYKSFQSPTKALKDHFFNELGLQDTTDKLYTFIEFKKLY